LSTLAEAVRRVATELGDPHIAALAKAYQTMPGCTPDGLATANKVVPVVHHAEIDRLHSAWALDPRVPGSAVALALESARLTLLGRDAPRVEVVVTGPDSPAVPIRLTSEVVVGLIAASTRRVTIVSYSVAQIPAVLDALAGAAARGVRINLIFESPSHFAEGAGVHCYGAHPIYHWPVNKRPAPPALLHAQAVIVDGEDILVTSANLSNLAYQTSLELGLLCRGGGIADRVQRHFDALIRSGQLQLAS
jgi:phosphatidylserine/phosphatidylglycerophosphate/cardiolipin synthase-like enzyme